MLLTRGGGYVCVHDSLSLDSPGRLKCLITRDVDETLDNTVTACLVIHSTVFFFSKRELLCHATVIRACYRQSVLHHRHPPLQSFLRFWCFHHYTVTRYPVRSILQPLAIIYLDRV